MGDASVGGLRGLSWVLPGRLAASSYPPDPALADVAQLGVQLIVNLDARPHPAETLVAHGLRELHLPVPDFAPPSREQLAEGVAAIERALEAGERALVHCRAGLGRTGTLLACYLVRHGFTAEGAIRGIRSLRPWSVETPEQEAAVHAFARWEAQRAQARP